MCRSIVFLCLLFFTFGNFNSQNIKRGVNGHLSSSESYKLISVDKQMALLKENNFKYYRVNLSVGEKGNLSPAGYNLVNTAKTNNVTIIPNISLVKFSFSLDPDSAYKTGLQYGKVIGENLGSLFSYIEFGNELNFKIKKGVDADNYLTYDEEKSKVLGMYLKGYSEGFKSVNKTTKIIMGCVGDNYQFLYFLKKYDVKFDIIGNTRYSFNKPDIFAKMYSIISKPIWILEFNFPKGTKNTSVDKQQKWLNSYIPKLVSNKYIDALFIYELLDENHQLYKNPNEAQFGIYKVKGNKVSKKLSVPSY